jgi:hypothetical protein
MASEGWVEPELLRVCRCHKRRLKDPRWDTVHTVIPLFNWERPRSIHSAAMNSIQSLHPTWAARLVSRAVEVSLGGPSR